MRTLSVPPTLRLARKPIVAIGLAVLLLYLAYVTAQNILANDFTSLALAGIVLVGGAVVIAVLNNWRRGLYVFIAWIMFEDFVRKYLGNNMALYFAKDFFVLLLYLSFFRAQRAARAVPFKIPFRVPLLLFLWFGVLQMFNPASSSIFYGILGVKVDFLYIPLIYIGYALMDSEEHLQRLLSFLCLLILIVGGLGLAQSVIGPTFLNPANLQEDIRDLSTTYRVSPVTGLLAYRPTSVFVSAGRFQDFLGLSWIIALGYAGYVLLRVRRGRALVFSAIGVLAAASLMSASRGVFLGNAINGLIICVGFLWGAPWRQREVIRVLRVIQRTVLLVGAAIIILLTLFPEELGSRIAIYAETLLPDSPTSELVQRTQTYPLKQLEYAFDHPRWPYGYGMGTCTLGGQYVVRIMGAQPMKIGVESGFGNMLVELGIVGVILWVLLGVSIAASAWKVILQLRGSPWFPLAFVFGYNAVMMFFPVEFVSSVAYQDFILNSGLWLLLGILFRLRDYPREVQLASAESMPDKLAPAVEGNR
jgi:hypothetical protein